MAIKIPSEITKTFITAPTFCWECDTNKVGDFYEVILRDEEGFCSDVSGLRCEECSHKLGLVEDYNSSHNKFLLEYHSPMNEAKRREELERERQERKQAIIDAKALEAQKRANKRKSHQKRCSLARRSHWIDKVNEAFAS